MDKKYYNNKKLKFTIIKDNYNKMKDIEKFEINVNNVNKCIQDYDKL